MTFIFQYILCLMIVFFEIRRKHEQLIDVLSVFNLVYFLCFVVSPIVSFFMLAEISDGLDYDTYSVLFYVTQGSYDFTSLNFYFTGLLTLFLYLVLILSYTTYSNHKKFTFLENLFSKNISYTRIYILGLVLLGLSVFALLYSIFQTSFSDWFFSSSRMHFQGSVELESVTDDPWLIDKMLMLAQVSALLFWGLAQKKFNGITLISNRSLRFVIPLFIIALGLSLLLLYRSSGRLVFFRFIAIFLIGGIYISRKNLLKRGVIMSVIGIFLILYGRSFFRFFLYRDHVIDVLSNQSKELKNSLYSFINNFTFPFFSASNNLNYLNTEYNLFRDLFKSPFSLVPSRFLEIDLNSTSVINTQRALGQPESTIPPDILSYGLINGGFIGVLLVGISFGIILKIVNSYASRLISPVAIALFIYLVFNLGFRVMYFDPIHFLRGTFPFIFAMIFYSFLPYKVRI